MKTPAVRNLSVLEIDRIIQMAWEDRTSFDAIRTQFGLTPGEVIALMRRELKPSSLRMWRARTVGRKTKHVALRASKSDASAVQTRRADKMPIKRVRTKPCDQCNKTNDVLYRVRIDETRNWIFACPACLEKLKPFNPHYQYGGTWKSKKRH